MKRNGRLLITLPEKWVNVLERITEEDGYTKSTIVKLALEPWINAKYPTYFADEESGPTISKFKGGKNSDKQ
jgi:predicted DNA-binding protein